MKNPWTQNDKKTVKRLILSGQSYSEIGLSIGRSRGSVARLVQKLREENQLEPTSLKIKPWAEQEIETASNLWADDWSITGIAAHLGRSKSVVVNLMRNNRETFPKKGRSRGLSNETTNPWFRDKPTPENTAIQYSYEEIPVQPDAIGIPFVDTKVGECLWILETFWQEPDSRSLCCGKSVVNLRVKGLRRSYCEFHYQASMSKEEER